MFKGLNTDEPRGLTKLQCAILRGICCTALSKQNQRALHPCRSFVRVLVCIDFVLHACIYIRSTTTDKNAWIRRC